MEEAKYPVFVQEDHSLANKLRKKQNLLLLDMHFNLTSS